MAARYPDLEVTVRSANPLALIAAVRLELRKAGIDRAEIRRFSEQALSTQSPEQVQSICSQWVNTGG